ncbi:hypothetical protein AMK24_31495, partial [Streptomyces sp. CB02366]
MSRAEDGSSRTRQGSAACATSGWQPQARVVLMVVFCAGIAGLALSAARRPRFAQLAFLVVAAFVLTNKVYSPQYVRWLI